MKSRLLRQRASLTLTLLTLALPPVLAAPLHLPGTGSSWPNGDVARAEHREAQNLVFTGHDGHILLPMNEDWVRYRKAEATLRSFPCGPNRDGQGRHRH